MWHNVHRESLSGLSVRPRAPGVPLDAGGSSFRPQVPRRCRATIHDNFDCLASPAERFRQIIREQFVKLYAEHDVLAEVLAEAHRDVGGQKLPSVPEAGGLDINRGPSLCQLRRRKQNWSSISEISVLCPATDTKQDRRALTRSIYARAKVLSKQRLGLALGPPM
jgi:hypothetical protein